MASLPAGTLLHKGRYSLVREINRGGTAVVYEAVDLPSGLRVALKVMNVLNGKLAVPAKALKREIEMAAGLRLCPHVVQLLDFFAEGEQAVLVWELVEGLDLLDVLNAHGGRLEEETAADFFAQLVRGVQYLHEQGLAHRDIKPENVLVETSTGRVKIIDFGLSKRQTSAMTLGVGTPSYMAPELIKGADVSVLSQRTTGSYDATKVDCWALGVACFLLVAGVYPFDDPLRPTDVVCTLRRISSGTHVPLPAHVSPACADLIQRLLVIDPAARLTIPGILAHPWLAATTAAVATAEAAASTTAEDGVAAGGCEMEVEGAAAADGASTNAVDGAADAWDVKLAAAAAAAASGVHEEAFFDAAEVAAEGQLLVELGEQAEQAEQSIAAYPASRTPSFSFAMGAGEVESKATPCTPRVINLTASAGLKVPAGPAPLAPAQQRPPSRGGRTGAGAASEDVSAGGCAHVLPPPEQQAAAKRQRHSATAAGSFFCSFFSAGLFGSGARCPRTSSGQE